MKRPLGLIPCIIGFVISIIFCFFFIRKEHHYYEKTVDLRREDSIKMEVTKSIVNHGIITFNDSLNIASYMVEEPNLKVMYFSELEEPFFLIKEANNDTIWLMNSNNTYFFVFKKDKGSNEYQHSRSKFLLDLPIILLNFIKMLFFNIINPFSIYALPT